MLLLLTRSLLKGWLLFRLLLRWLLLSWQFQWLSLSDIRVSIDVLATVNLRLHPLLKESFHSIDYLWSIPLIRGDPPRARGHNWSFLQWISGLINGLIILQDRPEPRGKESLRLFILFLFAPFLLTPRGTASPFGTLQWLTLYYLL